MNNYLLYSIIFLISVFVASASQILLKKSAGRSYTSKIKEYLNPMVIVAYILFFLSMLITMFAYKYVPLSMGPVLETTGYVYIAVLSYIFLKEKLSRKKLIGMITIILGILLFSFGGKLF